MCKHMGVRHAKTMPNHSRSNSPVELAGSQIFQRFRQLHIEEPGRNSFHSLWSFRKPPMAYRGLPDCLRTALYSYGIERLELSRG